MIEFCLSGDPTCGVRLVDRSGALGASPRLLVDMTFGPPVVPEFDVPRSFSGPYAISALSVCSHFFWYSRITLVILAIFLKPLSASRPVARHKSHRDRVMPERGPR